MQSIEPGKLTGPRAYFTALDHRRVARRRRPLLMRQVSRRLKLLLLLKSQVVVAASHLASDFAYELFSDCPQLLAEGHVVPALRRDKDGIAEVFEKSRFRSRYSAASFFSEHVSVAVRWDVSKNSGWFKERLLSELSTPSSVLSSCLSPEANPIVQRLERAIAAADVLGRDVVEEHAKELSRGDRAALIGFRDLLYYVFGARVVNCESWLPQENYLEVDLADPTGKRQRLSDEEILWKLVIELMLESLQARMIPAENLDLLTFDDVIRLRKPLKDSGFQQKYDRLVRSVVDRHERRGLLLAVDELDSLRRDLELTFREIFDEEILQLQARRDRRDSAELCRVTARVGLGLLGMVPLASTAASIVSVLGEMPSLVLNVGQSVRSRRGADAARRIAEAREANLRQELERAEIARGSEILDMIDILTRAIRAHLTI